MDRTFRRDVPAACWDSHQLALDDDNGEEGGVSVGGSMVMMAAYKALLALVLHPHIFCSRQLDVWDVLHKARSIFM